MTVLSLSIFLMLGHVLVTWLAGNKNIWAWRLGFMIQFGWIYMNWIVGAYGLFPLPAIMMVVYYRNMRNWGARG